MDWHELMSGGDGVRLPFHPDLAVPALTEVRLDVPMPPPVADPESVARQQVVSRLTGAVRPGATVAVGAGSRGLSDRVALLRGAIAGLRLVGAVPFVAPAMGSHGGATAEGQRSMLESLGITEESVGAEIRSTMETVEVARTASGMPLYLDRNAAGADHIFPVNRIKPHTCFKGPIESGVTKMAVVGFGKQPGAAQIHACGPVEMRNRILDGIVALKSTGRVLGGLGSLESASGEVAEVVALGGDDVGADLERALTEKARVLVPPLPWPQIDVLIVDRGGKDISGTTLDPNVTGRFYVHGLDEPPAPDVSTIVLLGITPVSAGNVLGIGFADFIPVSVARQIDWHKTYINCFTAGIAGVRRSRMPMVLPTDDDCIKAALSMCGRAFHEPKRVVRIESTLHLTRCWVSEQLLAELPPGAEVVG